MSDFDRSDSDQVGGGEASLGEAQSSNPPLDPEMLEEDAGELDADTDFVSDDAGVPIPEERDEEDPAPNAP